MQPYDLLGFGETMLRLSPPGAQTIEQSTSLQMYPAGSEFNVCCGMARLGRTAAYATVAADNPMGRFIANKAREQGVDTGFIEFTEHRQGLYFFENPTLPRPGMAYYDRADTGMANVQPEDFDWDTILPKTKIFLTSGITPALSSSAAATVTKALQTASQCPDTMVAFDINYRSKLWSPAEARRTLEPLLEYVDILLASAGDAETVFDMDPQLGEGLSQELAEQFSIPIVAAIYRPPESHVLWCISCYHGEEKELVSCQQHGRMHAVERLGAGDAFAAGFLTGYLEEGPAQAVSMGSAMMVLKNTFHGDITWTTRQQVQAIMEGDDSTLQR